MQIRTRYILIGVLFLGLIWLIQSRAIMSFDQKHNNLSTQQLQNVGKFPVWTEDFLLHNLDTTDKTYAFLSDAVISGKIGFNINLADSTHTVIDYDKDTITVKAPLQIAYISYDAATLLLINSAASNPANSLTTRQLFKYLDGKTLTQYLPLIMGEIKDRPLPVPEQKLTDLTGKPVHIKITLMPKASDWN